MTGDENGISIDYASNDLYGKSWKTKEADNRSETYTENAPFVPSEGLIVPERYVSESIWRNIM